MKTGKKPSMGIWIIFRFNSKGKSIIEREWVHLSSVVLINIIFAKIEKYQRDNNNHKGTRMGKDGEDWHGMQTTKLKSVA